MPASGKAETVSLAKIKIACKQCALRELCLPLGLDESDMKELDNMLKRRRTLKKRDYLYRIGDSLHALYAVKAGSLKTVGLMEDGRVQVVGFHLPSELLGLDAISSDKYTCDAVALEETELCEIPYQALEETAREIPGLQRQLLRIMSRAIVQEEHQLMLLGKMTAEERLAVYLLNLSKRQERLDLPADTIRLSMSRQDIADYLGLALETVSRLFSRFQDDGLISVSGRQIELTDMLKMRQILGQCESIKTGKKCAE
ncbi:MAG TPA: fumarate/nitrate reduction transcriptional regulator Fnr [Acidiferrobacteraceae bacterium]|nr:fumarate/nitrate reduction transcriptional regulator Fnr [Acidiferrobacteraceae bacterium]HEX20092.1 fumarate/nitrate reduction transcriptional regulator Fnr [Acidiferrobacteraceae bacterium]